MQLKDIKHLFRRHELKRPCQLHDLLVQGNHGSIVVYRVSKKKASCGSVRVVALRFRIGSIGLYTGVDLKDQGVRNQRVLCTVMGDTSLDHNSNS